MTRTLFSIAVALSIAACVPNDRGFRFRAAYGAPQSGFDVHLLSQGIVEAGQDVATHGYARMKICPRAGSQGRALDCYVVAAPGHWTQVFCPDTGLKPKRTERISEFLPVVLSSAGYATNAVDEIAGAARAIENALSGPKGVILRGQIDSVSVDRAEIQYGVAVRMSTPKEEWVGPGELEGCPPPGNP